MMSQSANATIDLQRDGAGWMLRAEQRIDRPIHEVFDFFSRAENLEVLTPDRLRFEIITPTPIDMHAGTVIDYKLRIRGMPVRWRTEIPVWDPPHRFVDEQQRGPYRWWIHEHTFEADGDNTIMRDTVRYGVPGGTLIHTLFVKRDVRAIFRYRANMLDSYMNNASRPQSTHLPRSAVHIAD